MPIESHPLSRPLHPPTRGATRSATSPGPKALPANRPESAEPGGGPVLAWGRDPVFRRTVADVAQAAERPLRFHESGAPPLWGPLDSLVIEAECVPELLAHLGREPGRPGPGPAVVVAGREHGADPWQAASELARWWAAPSVVVLPRGRGWLADRLAAREEAPATMPRIGVVGISGGIGTSSVCLWLADRLLDRGEPVVVVDAVPSSIGLDSCVSPTPAPGLRWAEVARLPRTPDPAALLRSLPAAQGLPILTAGDELLPGASAPASGPPLSLLERAPSPAPDGGSPPASGAEAPVAPWDLATLLSREASAIVDLGSAAELAPAGPSEGRWLSRCSALVVLVPFTLRGLRRGRELLRRWSPLLPLIPVGVGPRYLDVTDADVARSLGAEPLTSIPHAPSVCEAYECGRLLEAGRRRLLRRPVERIAAEVLSVAPRGAAAARQESPGPGGGVPGTRGGLQDEAGGAPCWAG